MEGRTQRPWGGDCRGGRLCYVIGVVGESKDDEMGTGGRGLWVVGGGGGGGWTVLLVG